MIVSNLRPEPAPSPGATLPLVFLGVAAKSTQSDSSGCA